jgi:DNA anti-recombination protein RmuC
MDVTVLVGTGVPLSAVAGFFLKAYLEKRKGDRADRKADRQSESGIVETTREALRIARDQMAQMEADTKVLRSRASKLEARLRSKESQLTELEATLRARGEDSRHQPNRVVPSQRPSPPDAIKDLPKRSGFSQ